MNKVYVRFAGLDQNSGTLFLQFAKENDQLGIENATIHGFFPRQYNASSFDELLIHMADMGNSILTQLEQTQFQNKFSQDDIEKYSSLIGTTKLLDISAADTISGTGSENAQNQYTLDSVDNLNKQSDHIRNIVLEILVEEGLIP